MGDLGRRGQEGKERKGGKKEEERAGGREESQENAGDGWKEDVSTNLTWLNICSVSLSLPEQTTKLRNKKGNRDSHRKELKVMGMEGR